MHWLDHMQIICTSLQTDGHISTALLSLQAGCSSCGPIDSVKALKSPWRQLLLRKKDSFISVILIRTRDENRFSDACPWDTVQCNMWICYVSRPIISEVERRRTVVWRNFSSTGQCPHVNLQVYSAVGLSYWGMGSSRPCCWLPADWRRYCSAWQRSLLRLGVVRHATCQGHVLASNDRSVAGHSTRWLRI